MREKLFLTDVAYEYGDIVKQAKRHPPIVAVPFLHGSWVVEGSHFTQKKRRLRKAAVS